MELTRDEEYNEFVERVMLEGLEESITLWNYLARTGGASKHDAIVRLFDQGKLRQHMYDYKCPMCHAHNRIESRGYAKCRFCHWPGMGFDRCERSESPYNSWCSVPSVKSARNKRAHYASQVAKLLKSTLKELKLRRPKNENVDA